LAFKDVLLHAQITASAENLIRTLQKMMFFRFVFFGILIR